FEHFWGVFFIEARFGKVRDRLDIRNKKRVRNARRIVVVQNFGKPAFLARNVFPFEDIAQFPIRHIQAVMFNMIRNMKYHVVIEFFLVRTRQQQNKSQKIKSLHFVYYIIYLIYSLVANIPITTKY